MVDVTSHSFDLGRLDDDRWAAASCSSPFFYFEGDTREAVLETARKALNFYKGIAGHIVPEKSASRPMLTRARRTETVRASDLVAA